MQSLLGQFYSRIKGSQEDIASESLVYILNRSARAKKAINQIIYIETGLKFSDLSYSTQNVGEKLERPDISGKDENGNEVLLIEAKFWASLTSNQPNEYLTRLDNNSVVTFLVPSLRERSIFEEVLTRTQKGYTDLEVNTELLKIRIKSTNQTLLIKNWNEILNTIKSELQQENNQNLISDIDQLIGFCETIDSNSFQPINDFDLSPIIPQKINSYYDIVDKVVDEIKNRTNRASTKGVIKTAQRYGYTRFFKLGNLGLGMGLKMDLWSEYADTPFWISISWIEDKSKWTRTEKLRKECENVASQLKCKFVNSYGLYYISLNPKLDKTEDIVINDLADKIESICKVIDK